MSVAPLPSLIILGIESVRSIIVDAKLSPKPPSITPSTRCFHFSKINSGSVVYSITSSSS